MSPFQKLRNALQEIGEQSCNFDDQYDDSKAEAVVRQYEECADEADKLALLQKQEREQERASRRREKASQR